MLNREIDHSKAEDYICTSCKKQGANRVQIFVNEPEVLVLHVKRFSWNQTYLTVNRRLIKTDNSIIFLNKTYNLSSIVHHLGTASPYSGHYMTYAKRSSIWFELNDERVLLLDEKKVFERSDSSYMYFYVRC